VGGNPKALFFKDPCENGPLRILWGKKGEKEMGEKFKVIF